MLAKLPLEEMTLEEKFITIETIWEDIVLSSPDFPSPAWHEEVLKERENLLKTGEEKLLDWESAKESLRNSLK